MAKDKAKKVDEEVVEAEVETPDVDTAQVEEEVVKIDPLVALQLKYDDLDDKYLRAQAEMQNMHSRFAKEQVAAVKYATQGLAKDLLPVIDNLERALAVEADDEAANKIKTGVEMVYNTLQKVLADNNIVAIGAVDEPFDANLHQSIQVQPADDEHPADTIATVMQKGYVLHDRVIRPAMVAIYN
ncbi:MAG: nucleotide exchange factor GrpE [Lactobacillaceae bacterium]|nr:nucleotide exchange factor GrpE [Lactobacillaceae bacterium]